MQSQATISLTPSAQDHSSRTSILGRLKMCAGTALLVLLAACGGGGDGGSGRTADLSGVAAIGAPIVNQTVTVTNANGAKQTATTNSLGQFKVTISEAAPYVLSVVDASGKTWYSYAPAAGQVNLNPMTTLAMLSANGNKPLADLVNNWSTNRLTESQILEAAKLVNANLQSVMAANGVTHTNVNIFNAPFTANGLGLDGVLDDLGVNISCSATSCTQTINWLSGEGTTTLAWRPNLDTSGITVQWQTTTAGGGSTGGSIAVSLGSCSSTAQAGTYSMIVRTALAGQAGVSVPEICVDGLPDKPASQSDFCADSDIASQVPGGATITSCSFAGDTGTIGARLSLPVATVDYTVSYTFVRR